MHPSTLNYNTHLEAFRVQKSSSITADELTKIVSFISDPDWVNKNRCVLKKEMSAGAGASAGSNSGRTVKCKS